MMSTIVGTRAEALVAEQNHNCSPMLSVFSGELARVNSFSFNARSQDPTLGKVPAHECRVPYQCGAERVLS